MAQEKSKEKTLQDQDDAFLHGALARNGQAEERLAIVESSLAHRAQQQLPLKNLDGIQ